MEALELLHRIKVEIGYMKRGHVSDGGDELIRMLHRCKFEMGKMGDEKNLNISKFRLGQAAKKLNKSILNKDTLSSAMSDILRSIEYMEKHLKLWN